jgi:hypothetical protein
MVAVAGALDCPSSVSVADSTIPAPFGRKTQQSQTVA